MVPTLDPEGTGGQDETGRYITFLTGIKMPIAAITTLYQSAISDRNECQEFLADIPALAAEIHW